MRILLTVPHYFASHRNDGCSDEAAATHGSQRSSQRERRRAIVARTLASVLQHFGPAQGMIQIANHTVVPANAALKHEVSVAVVVKDDHHLIEPAQLADSRITLVSSGGPELELGFAAQRVLAERLDQFDWFGYLEDDLWLTDPLFFTKIAWFTSITSPQDVLQPNRYELQSKGAVKKYPVQKCYVDGDLAVRVTEPFQSIDERPELMGRVMGNPVRFVRAANPHSGCFFLSQAQMRHWATQPDFGIADSSFVGPLESAATLGIMKTFRLYKPAVENAGFLELQHGDAQFIHQITRPD